MAVKDCTCYKCQAACQNKPGWFLPGEVDWLEGGITTFVLAPAITAMEAGTEYPSNPSGQCVFYRDGLCAIHPVKPFECRTFLHGQSREKTTARHERVGRTWRKHQEQIAELLGREPEEQEPDVLEALFGFW